MIQGDSTEYEKLAEWVKTLPIYSDSLTEILTCEIGVREGLGSKIIMDGIKKKLPEALYKHIAIDPYDNLKYQHYDDSPAYTADYTNEMRNQMEIDFKSYPNSEFVVSASFGSAMTGSLNADYKNVVEEVKVRSLNSKVQGKVNLSIGG